MSSNLEHVAATILATHLAAGISGLTLAAPSAPTVAVQGTAGVTSYSYRIVAASRGGKLTAQSTAGSTTTGAASLTSVNFNRITWTALFDAGGYFVYRTVGGVTQGLIARVAPGDALSVDDIGLVGDASSPPSTGSARVIVGQADPDAEQDYPTILILPRRFSFQPSMFTDEVNYPSTSLMIGDVGSWSGKFELRVSAKDQAQREDLQTRVVDLFLAAKRGVLVLTTPALNLGNTVTTYAAPIAFVMDNSGWEEEFVFAKKRFAFMDLMVTLPALVLMTAYTIDEYWSCLSEDLTTVTAAAIPVESISVDEFGTVTPE